MLDLALLDHMAKEVGIALGMQPYRRALRGLVGGL